MPRITAADFKRSVRRTAIAVAAIVIIGAVAAVLLWRDRESLDMIDWPRYPSIAPTHDAVTVTWLGVTTLLFDDGETQILIDGFFSRPSIFEILFGRGVESDAATINYVLDEYRMRRLAALIPVHSHYDHAMDVGAIANRSSASILGSESTAQIARGAGVPEDQIIVTTSGNEYSFGKFAVTMIDSNHAPIGWGGSVPYAGTIDESLVTPAPVSAWRAGKSYSIVIAHPHGTTLVQGSAGFREGALAGVSADVVMLGVSMLEGLGYDYAERYWQELVTTTGAAHVFPVHFDDFSKPFGEIFLYPRALENFIDTAGWLEEFRDTWDSDTRLHLPEFGKPVVLYPQRSPEA
ncbi:MAG: MBL fold metallo-hydrolase [Gammaproteobacteria bacterium]|nr:MBL fold metallo-hydrolase [Gammaproteobacteria bacterium]MDH3372780.1 MBL fold metallo-hydrolase [Gammaproteobacteria bacterium]MDH3408082.1 MBL fold metallo-hydrolase [Gammaproteobacteria bacterium]MDH3551637.1 MBL fold metallo-hydrolase [Gammaproteobacteria bacterium]